MKSGHFKSLVTFLFLSLSVCLTLLASDEQTAVEPAELVIPDIVQVQMKTSAGDILLELDAKRAPVTVQNFLAYVDEGFYDGTIFHRVIPNFMIQGGGFNALMQEKETREPIVNEAANGLINTTGTIAMARTSLVDSATAQFFINTRDNAFLDHTATSYGYAVFGKVASGMEVVRAIEATETASRPPFSDVPVKAIVIMSMQRVD
jgi:cyclophilin family peptidyl-prolyl cis-trans isomerase